MKSAFERKAPVSTRVANLDVDGTHAKADWLAQTPTSTGNRIQFLIMLLLVLAINYLAEVSWLWSSDASQSIASDASDLSTGDIFWMAMA